MQKINKLLVANRGEIALRVMRSARELGIRTVAIYSEADRLAPHVRYADEAVCVGPPPSAQSYLRGERIIEICHELGVDAIHPGYGFLSENAGFARAVRTAGLVFVGPSPEAMEVMGDKLSAKQAVRAYDIPLVPGTAEAITDVAAATRIAEEVGFPVLIKASAGGGGKGMRLVQNSGEFAEQMQLAVSEATSAFGDGAVFIEKFVSGPRHIEVQVLGDEHGNLVHLFERECSIQRRHQKVIEEAPSSVLTPELREQMGRAAVAVARACGYTNAGTVEFLLDDQKRFYFLEMNTRLQVEHPVTEQITGLDLVKEQIRIAEGQPLPFRQEDLRIRGHAIELRVYAEDPQNNFLPDIGRLTTYVRPQGPGVRVDDGFEQGMEVPIYYDPMLAKLVATGATRQEAIDRLLRAIGEYQVTGLETTLGFGTFVLRHPAFVSGNFDTNFVRDHFSAAALAAGPPDESTAQVAAALVALLLHEQQPAAAVAGEAGPVGSAWRRNRAGY